MEMIVCVRNVYKGYGKKSDRKMVLNNLDMSVQEGTIYGLLGASDCGKSTLLSCILGTLRLDAGHISVFGKSIRKTDICDRSLQIGYMPQETALLDELTIEETIYFFGNILRMNFERITERFLMLKNLLELPPSNQMVVSCSGGQRKRISFAVAMIHNPKLLILDEPTSGVDPVLREKIWDFMLRVTKAEKLTIIVTTQYIEEAKKADRCGLMRNGILLDEDAPLKIMLKYECDSLEDAFLKLSIKNESDEILFGDQNPQKLKLDSGKYDRQRIAVSWQILKSLIIKNLSQTRRNPSGIICMLLVPVVIALLLDMIYGQNPVGLKIAIVNDEVPDFEFCRNFSPLNISDRDCELHKSSCLFQSYFTDKTAETHFFFNKTREHIWKVAEKERYMAIIHLSAKFSEIMQKTLLSDEDTGKTQKITTNENKTAAITIRFNSDNKILIDFMKGKIFEAYGKFSSKITSLCGFSQSGPVKFEESLHYNNLPQSCKSQACVPILLCVIMFLGSSLTMNQLMCERRSGFWNRILLNGATTEEIVISHLISAMMIAFLFALIPSIYASVFFSLKIYEPSILMLYILAYLLTTNGMLLGMLISSFMKSSTIANLIIVTIGQCTFFVSGTFWPIEGMYFDFMQVISRFTLTTLSTITFKDLILKKLPWNHNSILFNLGILAAWNLILFLATLKFLKASK